MTAMKFDGCSRTMGVYNDGQLGELERVMCDSAQLHAHSSTHSRCSEMSRAPPALLEARRLSKAAVSKSEKTSARKLERKETRKFRAQQRVRAGGKNKSRGALRQFVCNDELTSDRVQWSEEVYAKCKDKYEDTNSDG